MSRNLLKKDTRIRQLHSREPRQSAYGGPGEHTVGSLRPHGKEGQRPTGATVFAVLCAAKNVVANHMARILAGSEGCIVFKHFDVFFEVDTHCGS